MVKKETVLEAIKRLAEKEVPELTKRVMDDKELSLADKIAVTGMLDTVQHHLNLILARLE